MTGLNPKQERFVLEYVKDLNATQAAIRAGYSAKTAAEQASRLLTNIKIKELVQKAIEKGNKKAALTIERFEAELAKLAFSDMRRLYDDNGNLLSPKEWDDEVAGAVAGVETIENFEGRGEDRKPVGFTKKVKLYDKNSALTLVARRLGLLVDKVDLRITEDLASRLEGLRRRRDGNSENISGK